MRTPTRPPHAAAASFGGCRLLPAAGPAWGGGRLYPPRFTPAGRPSAVRRCSPPPLCCGGPRWAPAAAAAPAPAYVRPVCCRSSGSAGGPEPPRSGVLTKLAAEPAPCSLHTPTAAPARCHAACGAPNSARAKESRAASAAAPPARPEPREMPLSVRTAPSVSVLGATGQSGSLAARGGVGGMTSRSSVWRQGRCSRVSGGPWRLLKRRAPHQPSGRPRVVSPFRPLFPVLPERWGPRQV